MNFVENNGKKVAAILCVASAFPVVATIYAMETEPGWHGDRYVNSDKTVAKGWKEIQGKSYYFDEENGVVKKDKTRDAVVANVSASVANDVETTVTESTIAAIEEENARIDAEAVAAAQAQAEAEQVVVAQAQPVAEVAQADVVAEPEVQQVANVEVPVAETEVAPQPAEVVAPVEETVVVEQPVAAPEVVAPVEEVAPAQTAPVATDSSLNSAIANAALSLVGVTNGYQCTDVAAMALQQAGISATSLWPAEMIAAYTTGVATSTPEAGNLIYYADGGGGMAHIAVYVGDGQAVHGNYNGQTVVAGSSVYGASAPIYYQVAGY